MCHSKSNFSSLLETVRALRGENGCPWDKRQTTSSMKKYLNAEMEKLLAAIDNNDPANTCEELGDLLFIIVLLAEIHTESANFTIDEVISGITAKLIRRHPHVFAGKEINSEEELRAQWQEIKAMEKSGKLI